MHGEYELTVTDSNGCTETFNFTVPFVNSTMEFNHVKKVYLRPNLVGQNGELNFFTDTELPLFISTIHAYTVQGIRFELASDLILTPGSTLSVDIPSAFSSGMYYLVLQLESGDRIPFRFVIN
jgi:hypothetical protein